MNLYEFVPLAIRTESPKDHFSSPRALLLEALKAYIAAGNILDQIKKHGFYGSDFDLPKYKHTLRQLSTQLSEAADNISNLPHPNEIPDTTFLNVSQRSVHSLIGCCTESSELAEILLNYLETGQLDIVHVTEEMIGDHSWYAAVFMDEYNIDPYQPLENVINKLKKRYPDKFTKESAETRDLTAEREILSTNIPK